MRTVDLGCGTGELTRHLHQHLGASETIGVDNSENMLASAMGHETKGLRFLKGDIGDFAAEGPLDLVFSNAALQWIPGHEDLFRRLTEGLAGGGQLAVQIPAMEDHPGHTVAYEVAGLGPFRDELGGLGPRLEVHAPEWYAGLLHRLGYGQQHVRLQVYPHILPSRDAVVDWYRGTLLTAYQGRLSAASFEAFVEAYRTALLPHLHDDRPFFFGFRRILLWGERWGPGPPPRSVD
jgi:trans-aconitate 2-methyltransferase